MSNKNWFITGISSGLGKALAETVIAQGDRVIGTFRQQAQVDTFNQLHPESSFAVRMDLTQLADIQAAVAVVKDRFGTVDVLVNNAGAGFAGAIEETSLDETRAVFETNFFGVLETTRAFLPLFRHQRSGHIVQISSHGGIQAFAGFGIYNASKFALEGFSEALAAEVAPLGIHVTLVEPGPFRTQFASSGFGMAEEVIEDYEATAGIFRQRIKAVDGKQEGDPQKAAQAIFEITRSAAPPLRLPLGKIALATISSKIERVQKDVNAYREIAANAVY